MPRVRRLLAAAVLASLSLAACGGGSGTDQMVRTGTVPVEQQADGRLAANPSPLTIEDVEKQPVNSPQRAVMQLILWAQWGNLPGTVDSYDRGVIDGIGVTAVAGSYDYMRPQLLLSQARIIGTRASGPAQFVSLELATRTDPPTREGFLLRRRNGRWRIVFDTLLETAVEGYTISQQEPGRAKPSLRAKRNGARAAQRYRDVYSSIVLAGARR